MVESLPRPPSALGRVLLRWSRRRSEDAEDLTPHVPPDEATAEERASGDTVRPIRQSCSNTLTLLVTRDEAARALYFFARAGVGAVVIDAAPDDWTPPECASAHGAVLSLADADVLPHLTTNGAPCRCRYRAAPPGGALRPSDAVWTGA